VLHLHRRLVGQYHVRCRHQLHQPLRQRCKLPGNLVKQVGQGAARDRDPEASELLGQPVERQGVSALARDDVGAQAVAVARALDGMVGAWCDDDVLPAGASQRLAHMPAATEVPGHVVPLDRLLALAHGLELGLATLGARSLCFRHAVRDVLGPHGARTQLRILPPSLEHCRSVDGPRLAHLAVHRRHLLALLAEHLPLYRGEPGIEVGDPLRQLQRDLLPAALVVVGRRDQGGQHHSLVHLRHLLVEFPGFMATVLSARPAVPIAVVDGRG